MCSCDRVICYTMERDKLVATEVCLHVTPSKRKTCGLIMSTFHEPHCVKARQVLAKIT